MVILIFGFFVFSKSTLDLDETVSQLPSGFAKTLEIFRQMPPKQGWWDFFHFFRVPSRADSYSQDIPMDVSHWQIAQELWRLAWSEVRFLFPGLLCLVLAELSRLSAPVYAAKAIQNLSENKFRNLRQNLKYLLAGALAYAVFSGLRGALMSSASHSLLHTLRTNTFLDVISLPASIHNSHDPSVFTSKLWKDCDRVADAVAINLNICLRSAITVIVGSILLFHKSRPLFLTVLLIILVQSVVLHYYGAYTQVTLSLKNQGLQELDAVASEEIRQVQLIHALNREEDSLKRYSQSSGGLLHIQDKQAAAYGIYTFCQNFLTSVLKPAVLGVGALMMAQPGLSAELLTASLFYVEMVVGSCRDINTQIHLIFEALHSARVVFALKNFNTKKEDLRSFPPFRQNQKGIFLDNVSFSYDSRNVALQNVTLSIPRGQSIAVIGDSGSGKSTLSLLLQRLYSPTSGNIFYEGQDIGALDKKEWGDKIGLVPQTPILFQGSIAENIAYGAKARPTLRAVVEAAQLADIHQVIKELPNGYNTVVGSFRALSGGERQRIALARALIRDPDILILDEATSALDEFADQRVHEGLKTYIERRRKLGRPLTVIAITHRLSTIKMVDLVMVLQEGQLIEQGSHATLMKSPSSWYRQLIKSEHNKTAPSIGKRVVNLISSWVGF